MVSKTMGKSLKRGASATMPPARQPRCNVWVITSPRRGPGLMPAVKPYEIPRRSAVIICSIIPDLYYLLEEERYASRSVHISLCNCWKILFLVRQKNWKSLESLLQMLFEEANRQRPGLRCGLLIAHAMNRIDKGMPCIID